MTRALVTLTILALLGGCGGGNSSTTSSGGAVSGISTPASVSVVTPTND